MLLNLNDPRSILAWWQVYPERHEPQLGAMALLRPEYAHAIKEARRLIASDPALAQRQAQAQQSADAMLSARWDSLADDELLRSPVDVSDPDLDDTLH